MGINTLLIVNVEWGIENVIVWQGGKGASALLLRLFQSDLFYLCRALVQSPAVPSAVVALRLRTGTDIHLHLVRALHGAKEQQRE